MKKYITQNTIPQSSPIKEFEINFNDFYKDNLKPNLLCPICCKKMNFCNHIVAQNNEDSSIAYLTNQEISTRDILEDIRNIDLSVLKEIDFEYYKKIKKTIEEYEDVGLIFALPDNEKIYFFEKFLQYYFEEEIIKIRILELEESPIVFYFKNTNDFFTDISNQELIDIFYKNSKTNDNSLSIKEYSISINDLYEYSDNPIPYCPICEKELEQCDHLSFIYVEGDYYYSKNKEVQTFENFCNSLVKMDEQQLKNYLKNENYISIVKLKLEEFQPHKKEWEDNLYEFLEYETEDFFEIYLAVSFKNLVCITVYEKGFGCSGGPIASYVDFYLENPSGDLLKMKYSEFKEKVNNLAKNN